MPVIERDRTRKSSDGLGAGRLKFANDSAFYQQVQRRVTDYFIRTGKRQRDCPRMYLKTALIIAWFVASYTLLLFVASVWWTAIPLAISLGLAMAAIGFSIQHDASHRAYSDRQWVNSLLALTLDVLGGSSYVWRRKHNTIHHSYSNITGHDDDIDVGVLGRLTPHQPWLRIHRLQHYYLWGLYALLPIKWQFYDDFRNVIAGRIGGHRLAWPKGWDLANFIGGKLVFFSLAFVIPLLLHSIWAIVALYLLASCVLGVVLSVVFQLAHCVEEANFPMPDDGTGRMAAPWAVHQVETTVNFAPDNRLVSWYVGGLNFQIEHHLFPNVCHIHYPAIARTVEATCAEFGVRYDVHPTLFNAIASHFRWLRRMGQAPALP